MFESETPCGDAGDTIGILVERDIAKIRWLMYNNDHANACSIWWIHEENEISFHISHLWLILSMQEYSEIEPSDGNWSFTRISFTGSSQTCVLTAACQINQVCNGPYCRHDKKSKRYWAPYGLMKRPVTGRISKADAASLKRRVFRHFTVDPNDSLNYLLSRVNINDVWELDSLH